MWREWRGWEGREWSDVREGEDGMKGRGWEEWGRERMGGSGGGEEWGGSGGGEGVGGGESESERRTTEQYSTCIGTSITLSQQVTPDGAAYAVGKLKPGDRILRVSVVVKV